MIYSFEDYSLDTMRRELRRGAELVAVEPQVFDLLQYLIAHGDRVISKDELLDNVWGGRIVSDSAITSRITAVRQSIGDSGETQRLIRTVPRKGFRFIGGVQTNQQTQASTPPPAGKPEGDVLVGPMQPPKPSIVTSEPSRPVDTGTARDPGDTDIGGSSSIRTGATQAVFRRGHRFIQRAGIAASMALLLVSIALAALAVRSMPDLRQSEIVSAPQSPGARFDKAWRSPSLTLPTSHAGDLMAAQTLVPLVVLPFKSRNSNGGDDQMIADAITEDVSSALSRFHELRVIAHRTALSYAGQATDVAAVGAELGVRYVVEGSVRSDGDRLHVTVQLIDAASRLYAWTESFDRDRTNVFEGGNAIAMGLARALQVGVTLARSRDTIRLEPEIGALIAKGFATQYGGFTYERLTNALTIFEEALVRAPGLPSAMVAVAAASLDLMSNYSVSDRRLQIERSEKLLRRALEKQPDFANAHFYLGRLHKLRADYPLAQQSLLRALELNPSLSPAYAQLGHTLVRQGRALEGLEHILYAIKLSPKDPSIGFKYYFAGEAALELGDNDLAQHWLLRAHAKLPGSSPFVPGWLAAAYALNGNATQASKHAAEFRSLVSQARIARLIRHLKHEAAPGHRRRLLEGLELALGQAP